MRTTNVEDLNDDDASMYGHSDSFMVELRIDVFQDVTAKEPLLLTHRMRYPGIERRRDHWLVALQSVSYSIRWTLPMTSKR